MSNQAKKDCKTLIAVILSAFVYALAMKAFVETGNLFPGGFADCLVCSACRCRSSAGLRFPSASSTSC